MVRLICQSRTASRCRHSPDGRGMTAASAPLAESARINGGGDPVRSRYRGLARLQTATLRMSVPKTSDGTERTWPQARWTRDGLGELSRYASPSGVNSQAKTRRPPFLSEATSIISTLSPWRSRRTRPGCRRHCGRSGGGSWAKRRVRRSSGCIPRRRRSARSHR